MWTPLLELTSLEQNSLPPFYLHGHATTEQQTQRTHNSIKAAAPFDVKNFIPDMIFLSLTTLNATRQQSFIRSVLE